jgi:hypothetical protein
MIELYTGSGRSGNGVAVLHVESLQNRVDVAILIDVKEVLTAVSVDLHAEEVLQFTEVLHSNS